MRGKVQVMRSDIRGGMEREERWKFEFPVGKFRLLYINDRR